MLFLSLVVLQSLVSVAQVAKDSTPLAAVPKLNLVTKLETSKYDFGKIGAKKYTIGNSKANYELQAASTGTGLSYNLNLEAHEFINRFKVKNETELRSMKSWGAYYLTSMENILASKGIPKQLVYLAVIETHLNTQLVSWAGAAGMWQFMPETGRMYGLRVGGGDDERFDWHKSTYAAADYLRYLYGLYGDWLLVVAAYNGGPGRISRAMKASGKRDFWALQYHLPTESSNHVKKFIATQYIMEGSTAIASMRTVVAPTDVKKKAFNPLEKGAVAVDTSKGLQQEQLSGRYNSLIIAKYIMLDIQSFNIMNPNFDAELAKNESAYTLKLPEAKMILFRQNKLQIMNESLYLFLTLNGAMPQTETPVAKPVKRKKKK